VPRPDPDRAADILDLNAAPVAKAHLDPISDALVNDGGNTDSPGLGNGLQPGRDVDAIAIDVVAIDDDVAKIDPDPEHDRRTRLAVVVCRHRALNFDSTADRVHNTAEFGKRAVSGQLHYTTVVRDHGRVEHSFPVQFERRKRACFIRLHQARVVDRIRCKHGGQPSIDALINHTRLLAAFTVREEPFATPVARRISFSALP
jgi:hypothetical protein